MIVVDDDVLLNTIFTNIIHMIPTAKKIVREPNPSVMGYPASFNAVKTKGGNHPKIWVANK